MAGVPRKPKAKVERFKGGFARPASFRSLLFRALTPGLLKEVRDLLKSGAPPSLVAQELGLTERRINVWCAKGEKVAIHVEEHLDWPPKCSPEDKLAMQLFVEVGQAYAKKARQMLENVEFGSNFDWRAAAWWLEKRVPEFAPRRNDAEQGPRSDPASSKPQVVLYAPDNGRLKK